MVAQRWLCGTQNLFFFSQIKIGILLTILNSPFSPKLVLLPSLKIFNLQNPPIALFLPFICSLIVTNKKKTKIRLRDGLIATQGPLLSAFSAPLGCPCC